MSHNYEHASSKIDINDVFSGLLEIVTDSQ